MGQLTMDHRIENRAVYLNDRALTVVIGLLALSGAARLSSGLHGLGAGREVVWSLAWFAAAALVLLYDEARRLPLQNILTYALAISVMALFGQGLSALIGLTTFTPAHSNAIAFNETLPLHWIALVLGARAMAHRLLWRWRAQRFYGVWILAVTWSLLQISGVLFAKHFAAAGLAGASLIGLTKSAPAVWNCRVAWAGISLVTLVFTTPLLFDKRTRAPAPPRRISFAVAILTIVFLCAGAVSSTSAVSEPNAVTEDHRNVDRQPAFPGE